MNLFKTICLCMTFLLGLSVAPAYSQVAGANQSIFSDEQRLLQVNQQQMGAFEQERAQAEQELQQMEAKNQPYRLKVVKEITDLKGKKDAASQAKLKELQDWISRDDAYKKRQEILITRLTQSIQSLQRSQMETTGNLSNDITAMRQNVQDQKDAAKFDRMMRMNYFNELQSEMGAASWGRPPTDGTFNSVGGYGFMGGYGMSAFGRQAGGYGRW